jgi:predicted TIM-barrel fold metal-dependent hydrolase
MAVVPDDTPTGRLLELHHQGVVGIAFNYALHGIAYYADAGPLMERLAALDMFVQVQVEQSQMAQLAGPLRASGARILVDHCGRPPVSEGVQGAGFQALLGMAGEGRTTVKLSGYAKFSQQDYPFADTETFTQALLDTFGPAHCIWASDWPFLKAERRLDYGALLQDFARRVPDAALRHEILWRTPARLFGFDVGSAG